MVGAFLLTALVLLLLGAGLLAPARTVWRTRGRLGAAVRTLAGLLLLALALLAATLAAGIRGYRALTFEELAATVRTEPLGGGRQRFRATITLPDHRLAMYDLAGDAFYVDAHILKWHPLLTALGLHTAYELDRVAGRYNDVGDERAKPHTVYALARPRLVDLFFLARRGLLGPLVDAAYGSATFVPAGAPATYEVRVSATGLLLRRAPPAAPAP
jgi:hypothetical protein